MNSEKARTAIRNFDRDFDVKAVKILEGSPRLQLNYLKGILSERDEGVNIPDELLILHIKLLCQLYPKQVMEEAKKNDYPIEACLQLCREYSIPNGLAFFLEKAGNVSEALDITLDVIYQLKKED